MTKTRCATVLILIALFVSGMGANAQTETVTLVEFADYPKVVELDEGLKKTIAYFKNLLKE